VAITEIGGTVGDIESLPFIEAIRQFALERASSDVMFIHLTLLPYLRASGEMKTKPTQQSVGKLREIGIQPDVLVCRTELPMSDDMARKISLFCNVRREAVIEERDVEFSIYEVPLMLVKAGLDKIISRRLHLPVDVEANFDDWRAMIADMRATTHRQPHQGQDPQDPRGGLLRAGFDPARGRQRAPDPRRFRRARRRGQDPRDPTRA
jgi:CTP synthase